MTEYQDQQWVIEKAVKQLAENKNRRISAMFREFRAYPHYSLLGDYILLASIAGALRQLSLPFKRGDFSRAMRKTEEFADVGRGELRDLLDQLENLARACVSPTKTRSQTDFLEQDTHLSTNTLAQG